MKKLYILILLSTCSFISKAQYTITAATNPIAGDIESFIDIDSTGLFLGSSGTSQTWNYTAITTLTVNPPVTNTYVAMSTVPNNTMFPTATIAVDDGAGNFGILSDNSTKHEYLGYANAVAANCWAYTDPYKVYTIPFTYGSVSTDTYLLAFPTDTTTGTFTTTGDGTGTLQLPTGNYTNVLKVNYFRYENDTYASVVYDYTVTMDQYYSAVSKFLLLEVQTTTTSVTSGTNVTWYYNKYGRVAAVGLPTGITNKEKRLDVNLFPNPFSNGELFITNNDPSFGKMTIEINNVLGQSLKTISFENQNANEPKRIDVRDLAKGIYYLRISSKETSKTQKVIIE